MTVHHVSQYFGMGCPKEHAEIQNWAKKLQKQKRSQKFILHFSEASLHVPWCFIPQTKSPTWLIKWLKGYSEIFTYARKISNQSWVTNRWTICGPWRRVTQLIQKVKQVGVRWPKHGFAYTFINRTPTQIDIVTPTSLLTDQHRNVYTILYCSRLA